MPTPRISVIVPIYKVEDCLAWCLNSLVAQDAPDFEAILVNDGSPMARARLLSAMRFATIVLN